MYRKLIASLLIPVALLFAVSAFAKIERPPHACVFDKAIVFGASISANTMYNMTIAPRVGIAIVAPPMAMLVKKPLFGVGPGTELAEDYASRLLMANLAASFAEPTGAEQVQSIIDFKRVKNKTVFSSSKNASSIIGVDAFYWDAVWNTCKSNLPQTEIPRLIEFAKDNKIVLVLGTVPFEDPDKIFWEKTPDFIRENAWHPPIPSCVRTINQLLKVECKQKDQCYIIDMNKMVQAINGGGKLKLSNGRELNLVQTRPDGVHLSSAGSRYVQEQILDLFQETAPECSEK